MDESERMGRADGGYEPPGGGQEAPHGLAGILFEGPYMNKTGLASAISHRHRLSQAEAMKIVDTLTEMIGLMLVEHGRVNINRFGRFRLSKRKARQGRNPRTGEAVQIKERTTVLFTPAEELRLKLNVSKREVER